MVASKQPLDRIEDNFFLNSFSDFEKKKQKVLQLFFKTNKAKEYQRLTIYWVLVAYYNRMVASKQLLDPIEDNYF